MYWLRMMLEFSLLLLKIKQSVCLCVIKNDLLCVFGTQNLRFDFFCMGEDELR